jgi:hypothetical protein
MTDSNRLADYDIKDFGKLTSNQSIASYFGKACLECRNNHSFWSDLDNAITFINLVPDILKNSSSISTTNLQEIMN